MAETNHIPTGPKFQNLVGQKFARLLVISWDEANTTKASRFNCLCDCGKIKSCRAAELKSGSTVSCGCYRIEHLLKSCKTHGMSNRGIYEIWKGMRQRCLNPKNPNYKYYGGRGITICSRWNNFANFSADMGRRPSPKHSMERIDNNKNYEKSNCRWATSTEQCGNRRTSRLLSYHGRTQPMCAWQKELGFSRHLIQQRLKRGWTIEQTFEIPPQA